MTLEVNKVWIGNIYLWANRLLSPIAYAGIDTYSCGRRDLAQKALSLIDALPRGSFYIKSDHIVPCWSQPEAVQNQWFDLVMKDLEQAARDPHCCFPSDETTAGRHFYASSLIFSLQGVTSYSIVVKLPLVVADS